MWKSDSYYYEINKSELTDAQIIEIDKSIDGYKVIKTGSVYFIKKNWIQCYGEISIKTLATPVTVSLDAASIIVVGAISDPKAMEILLRIAFEAACSAH